MDELSYHPYPNASTDKLETGYSWPNAGMPNLDRIKQAVWDAFNGTAQPTFAEPAAAGAVPSLKLRIAEVGWQVVIPGVGAPTPARRTSHDRREEPGRDYQQAIGSAHATRPCARCSSSGCRTRRTFALAGGPPADGRDAAALLRRRSRSDSLSPRRCAESRSHLAPRTGVGVKTSSLAARSGRVPQRKWGFSLTDEENAMFVGALFRSRAPRSRRRGARSSPPGRSPAAPRSALSRAAKAEADGTRDVPRDPPQGGLVRVGSPARRGDEPGARGVLFCGPCRVGRRAAKAPQAELT